MIEQSVSLGLSDTQALPPGLLTNGTMFDRQGRWANGNLVRFSNGYPEPIGDWSVLALNGTFAPGQPSGAVMFFDPVIAKMRIIVTSATKVYAVALSDKSVGGALNVVQDVTPASLASLSLPWSFDVTPTQALVAREKLWTYDYNDPSPMEVASGSPACRFVIVTPEQFVMLSTSVRDMKWASQGTTSIWTPTTTNSAGGLTLQTDSALVCGRRCRGQTLLWTKDELWALDYVGAPLYYGATRVGAGCGALTSNAVTVAGDAAYWMSRGGFFKYDGFVQPMPCDVYDDVFNPDFAGWDSISGAGIWTSHNPQEHEITWFYKLGSAVTPDRYVSYNYVNNSWSKGLLARVIGTDAIWPVDNGGGRFEQVSSIMFDTSATFYRHESGGAATGAYIESGPFQAGSGDNTALVQRLIPDSRSTGDQVTLISGMYPGDTETSYGPYTSSGSVPIDTRFRARYVRFKQTLTQLTSRVGIPRLGVIPSSKR